MDYFHFLDIIIILLWTCAYTFLCAHISISFGFIPKGGVVVIYGISVCQLETASPFYIPTSHVWVFQFLHIFIICCFPWKIRAFLEGMKYYLPFWGCLFTFLSNLGYFQILFPQIFLCVCLSSPGTPIMPMICFTAYHRSPTFHLSLFFFLSIPQTNYRWPIFKVLLLSPLVNFLFHLFIFLYWYSLFDETLFSLCLFKVL